MIKRIYIVVLIASAHTAASQTRVAEIVAPSSPAASVIGLQPTEILAPKSAKALETTLYSNFVSNNALKIPNDFAWNSCRTGRPIMDSVQESTCTLRSKIRSSGTQRFR